MKIFSRFTVAVLLSALCIGHASAQWAVFDATNFMGQIEDLYAAYERIEQGYTSIQNLHDSLENQASSLEQWTVKGGWKEGTTPWDVKESFKSAFSNPDGSGISSVKDMFKALSDEQKIMNTRKSIIDMCHTVSEDVDNYNALADNFENQTAIVNGQKISMGGLLGLGTYGDNDIGEVVGKAKDTVKNDFKDAYDIWADKLSPAQREKIARVYGVSPKVYYEQRLMNEYAGELTKQAMFHNSDMIKSMTEIESKGEAAGVQALVDSAGKSTNQHLQAVAQAQLVQAKATVNTTNAINNLAAEIGVQQKQNAVKEEMERDKKALEDSQDALDRLHNKVPEDQLKVF